MTMTTPTTAPGTIQLPDPTFPLVTRIVSRPVFAVEDSHGRRGEDEPLSWILGKKHPRMGELKIVRMFYTPGIGAEVYLVDNGGTACLRVQIPMQDVRFVEEAMPPAVFALEISAAEAGADDDDDDGEDDGEDDAPESVYAEPESPNGQTSTEV